ncbi:hypothetical protein NQD34_017377 [Periophthalmus magnuspinnatus]|nr:hypothetical protein NQD34_017377 [Periophthalmus magnuspinnatus]
MLNSSMPCGLQCRPTPELKTKDQTYGMKKSSGWSSSTYLNLSSGNFCQDNKKLKKIVKEIQSI